MTKAAGARYQPGVLTILVLMLAGMVYIAVALVWLTLRLGWRAGAWLCRPPTRYAGRYGWIGQHRRGNHLEGNHL